MSLYSGIDLPGKPDLENVRKLDLLPLECIGEMMRYGMAVDIDHFHALTSKLDAEMTELRSEICSYIPAEKLDEFVARSNLDEDSYIPMNVESGAQLGRLLFEVLGIGAGSKLKMTKSGTRLSTGKKQLEQLKRSHPVIPAVLGYREASKLKGTYSTKMPLIAKVHPKNNCWCGLRHLSTTKRIHTTILTTRTTTSRLASKNPNLQNIPTRTKNGAEVRRGFVASPGTELVGVDFGQAEMRIGAHYSQDANLIRIFDEGLDPHTDTAMRAFNKTKEEVESKLGKVLYRAPCKNVNFGVFYQLGPDGLYDLMAITYATAGLPLPDEIDKDWCEQFISKWFELYPDVKGYLETQSYRARRYGVVWDLFGRIRQVPEVRSVHNRVVSAGLRQSGNMPIQATQAEWMKLAMAEVMEVVVKPARRDGIWVWPLITVHDELILEVEEGYGEMVRGQVVEVFERVMEDRETGENRCRVKVAADGKVMSRWEK